MNEGERMEGGKRSQTKNVMPVSARMILQHHEEEGPFQVCGVEVGMVAMAVQVRQVVKGDTSISYTVEDDTGRMEAVHYHDERTIPAMKNTFVKIVGVLKTGREKNMVTVYRLSTITDMDEVTAHQLELVVTPLRIMRQQKMAAGIAHASLAGMPSVDMAISPRAGSLSQALSCFGPQVYQVLLQGRGHQQARPADYPQDGHEGYHGG